MRQRVAQLLVSVAFMSSGFACEPRRAAPDVALPSSTASPSTAGPSSPGAPSSSAAASELRVRPIAGGYGGVGPATPAPHPDTWVVLWLEVEARAKRSDVSIKEVELVDAAGT